MKITHDDVTDTVTLLQYVFDWQDDIYIRVQRNGKWQNSSFAEATSEEKAKFIHSWLDKGMIPVRVLREVPNENPETVGPG